MMLNQCFIDKHLSCYFCLLSSVYFTFDHLILAKIFNNSENIMARSAAPVNWQQRFYVKIAAAIL